MRWVTCGRAERWWWLHLAAQPFWRSAPGLAQPAQALKSSATAAEVLMYYALELTREFKILLWMILAYL